MPSINDLPQNNISPATFEVLSTLVNLSGSDLTEHLNLTIAMLLAYEGADISAETQSLAALVQAVTEKVEGHEEEGKQSARPNSA
jgi:hypothetical protein